VAHLYIMPALVYSKLQTDPLAFVAAESMRISNSMTVWQLLSIVAFSWAFVIRPLNALVQAFSNAG
jgi:hypothetical protein